IPDTLQYEQKTTPISTPSIKQQSKSSSVKTGVARLKQNSRLALPGIVSPRSAIESEWERVSTFFSLQLATVDSFQGQERNIVILSTCRTKLGSGGFTSGGSGMIEKLYDSLMNNDTNESGSKKFESFLASPQRLAVAITRARAHLIVFGSGQVLSHAPLWSNILNTARKQKRRVLVSVDGNKEQIINKQSLIDLKQNEQYSQREQIIQFGYVKENEDFNLWVNSKKNITDSLEDIGCDKDADSTISDEEDEGDDEEDDEQEEENRIDEQDQYNINDEDHIRNEEDKHRNNQFIQSSDSSSKERNITDSFTIN
ncbi:MAG: hypothetical protein EZS28_051418, partial [Streblomastix strix]